MTAPAKVVVIVALLQAPVTPIGVRISGRVVDGETGAPIPAAIVTLSPRTAGLPLSTSPYRSPESAGQKRTATAGSDGTFQFLNVPRGSYELSTAHPRPTVAYRSESLEITITDRDLTDVGMVLSPALPRVLVTGRVGMVAGNTLPSTMFALKLANDVFPVARDGSFQLRMRPFEKYDLTLQNAPEGYFVDSISAGETDSTTGTWMIRERPSAPIQITVGIGRQRIRGRVLTSARTALTQGAATLVGPAPLETPRSLTLAAGGVFSVGGIRPGDYELRAQTGVGDAPQAGVLRFTVGAENRENLELVLKEMSAIAGQIVVSGRSLQDLLSFKPVVEIEDLVGRRNVTVDARGGFQFRSFEGNFTARILDLPIEFRMESVTMGPATVTIRVTSFPGNAPPSFERLRILK